jgi:hypothetical protein
MPQAPVELAVQGVPEASHCGVVTSEHLRRDHRLHLVPRRDAGQSGDDDGAHFVPLLLVAAGAAARCVGFRVPNRYIATNMVNPLYTLRKPL